MIFSLAGAFPSERLDRFDPGCQFDGQHLNVGMERFAFASRQFVQQIGERRDFASWECGEACCVGQSATYLDKFGHAPGAIDAAGRMVVANNGLEIGRQLPIGNQASPSLTMVATE